MKKFILGFIVGGIICAAVTGFAVEYAVTVNPFPVKVNGVETAIEGYNINDETYFKLRDVSAAVGGFEVGFEDNAIIVNTPSQPTATPTPIPTAKTDLSPLPELPIEKREGKEYVSAIDVNDMLKTIGLEKYSVIGHDFYSSDDIWNPLLSDIPLSENGIGLIPLDYYTSIIVPVINSLR